MLLPRSQRLVYLLQYAFFLTLSEKTRGELGLGSVQVHFFLVETLTPLYNPRGPSVLKMPVNVPNMRFLEEAGIVCILTLTIFLVSDKYHGMN